MATIHKCECGHYFQDHKAKDWIAYCSMCPCMYDILRQVTVMKDTLTDYLPAPNIPAVSDFESILLELKALHDKKGADYGQGQDPLANVRASADFGIPPWIGVAVRMNDKVTRIKSFIKKGKLENESLEDSIIDIANYAIIMLQLYRESK